jgi:hypothetical protein
MKFNSCSHGSYSKHRWPLLHAIKFIKNTHCSHGSYSKHRWPLLHAIKFIKNTHCRQTPQSLQAVIFMVLFNEINYDE